MKIEETKKVDIVTELKKRKGNLGISDTAFARLLGISRSAWSLIQSGKRPVGLALLRGIARSFPDMDGMVLDFLRSEPKDDADRDVVV
jgi:transcriptional regulator with XRE-family HTH domain